jgi:hypothetical protein
MGRGQNKFKQADVERAIKAVRATGEKVVRVEIDPHGKIVVVTTTEAACPARDDMSDEEKRWLKEHGH